MMGKNIEEMRAGTSFRGEVNGRVKGFAASVRVVMDRMQVPPAKAMDVISVPKDLRSAVMSSI